MQQLSKNFSERLNSALDDLGLPANPRDRATAFAKLIDIPKPQAIAFLTGHAIPNDDLLQQIATELEVEPEWLAGNKKK